MGKERFVDLIQKKKNGETLTKEEIDFMITDYVAGKIPDYRTDCGGLWRAGGKNEWTRTWIYRGNAR